MTKYSSRYASSPQAVKKYDTKELREEFLIDDLMQEDEVVLVSICFVTYPQILNQKEF